MITAYRLSTGADGHSHVERGTIADQFVIDAQSVMFKETAAGSSSMWHNAPAEQYVLTLSGVLEFAMHSGATFTLRPGDILLALDTTGSGHTWRLIDEQPWKRAYVVIKPGTDPQFIPAVSEGR